MTSNKLKHKAKLQEWSLAVQECRSSGKPDKQWCSENKIKVTTYYRWERGIFATAGRNYRAEEGCDMKNRNVFFGYQYQNAEFGIHL